MKSYSLFVSKKASEEYSDAFWFYEGSRPGLGIAFEAEVEKLFQQIQKNPYLFPRRFKRFREALVKRFPFFIVYEIIRKTAVIHSVFHTSRNPEPKEAE
jgi:plasmid stabilization system protein ParE